ncbi:MAG: FprA family A-type flavoprotein [Deltaproteobacteria bacterium]|nr:MAG: FprA family A-type flavoprotein [Deltaproteobacteria bacterium]
MQPVEIAKDVYCLPSIDWNIRDFHGYSTYPGSTYNAYLILDEKVTLIDTTKKEFGDELLDAISQVVDPKRIDYVISNHTEMDHTGALPRVMHKIGEDKPIYCSKMGQKNIAKHFGQRWNLQPVENGGKLSLGNKTLTFLETRMVHWPDSMFTYLEEDKILFSSDGFGQHYASLERFDDQVGEEIMYHAQKYYANILLLYSPLILKLIEKVKELNLQIDMICPDHGIIWRKDPGKIINAYVQWGKQEPKRRALIVYDTMWHSTETMAEVIAEALWSQGIPTVMRKLRTTHRSDIVTEVLDAGAIIVGSPTLNNGLFPTIADILTYMKGLKPINKVGAAFGSYGWSGEAVKLINEQLEAMKFNIVHPGVRVQYVPDEEAKAACRELAKSVAEALPAG